jgi:hypothetical protein
MKLFRFYIFLLIIASCKPEELPPNDVGTPVFSVSGSSVDITAGKNDFYLFTDYKKDADDVYSFIARFAKLSDCESDCKEELLIEIRDAQQTSAASGVDIDNALTPGNYSYKVSDPVSSGDSIVINLIAEPEGSGPFSYEWEVVFDSTDTFNSTSENVTLTLANNANIQSLDVCLMVADNNFCQMEYCNTIALSPNTSECQADFNVNYSPALLQLEANDTLLSGTAPFTYLWDNGSTLQTVTLQINGPLNETYCVTVTDSTGCSDDICKEVTINQGGTVLTVCGSRFSYEKTIEPGGNDSLQLSTVLIQYTDTDGTVYRSDYQEQSSSQFFAIEAIEDYENNENGDKTKKLTVSANCVLYDDNGVPFPFPFEGVIAIAYP